MADHMELLERTDRALIHYGSQQDKLVELRWMIKRNPDPNYAPVAIKLIDEALEVCGLHLRCLEEGRRVLARARLGEVAGFVAELHVGWLQHQEQEMREEFDRLTLALQVVLVNKGRHVGEA